MRKTMSSRSGPLTALALLAIMSLAPTVHGATQMKASVLGNGGSPMASGARRLNGTVGQAAIGFSQGNSGGLSHGFWSTGLGQIVGVEDPPNSDHNPTRVLSFGRPSPNPSRGPAAMRLSLPHAATVELSVLDVQGRRVAQIGQGHLDPGDYVMTWTGQITSGTNAGPGVFFARLTVDGVTVGQHRLVRIR